MIAAVVLAAGRSRRMGTQKLLLPLVGQPLIARIVDQLLASPVERILVVVGADKDRIAAALADRRVEFVENPDPDGEMLSSVRCGLGALAAQCDAVLVVLGDQPGLTAKLVTSLVRAFETSGRGMVVPAHCGNRGHPILIALKYRDEIMTCYDEVGLRGLVQAHAEDVFEVEVDSPQMLVDMDVPEDYRRAASQLAPKQDAQEGM
ncbi:MAG: nucleotidyltransferase family protein [Pirellulales bacterium]